MGYRITYIKMRRRFPWWVLLIPAAGLALLWREGWYEELARYVGASIYGH